LANSQTKSALVAGAGSIGRRHLSNLKKLGLTRLAACDPHPERLEYVASEFGAKCFSSLELGLKEFKPEVVLICTPPVNHVAQALQTLRAGAHGYVVKTASGAELVQAVKAVSAGHQFVSPTITRLFPDGVPGISAAESPFERLSKREREVLRRIVAGLSSADIAQQLGLSPKTVDTYRGRLMVKLGVSNRSALIRLVIEHELPSP